MPPAIIAAAITYGTQVLIVKAAIATALLLSAVTFVVTGVAYLYAQRMARKAFDREAANRMTTVRNPIAPHRVVYGEVRVGGAVVYMGTSDANQYLHIVVVLAGHEVESIGDIYFNDELVPLDGNGDATGNYSGVVRVLKKLGTDTQTAFAELVAESENGEWTNDHRLRGRACIYVRLRFNQDKFPNGVPNVTAIVRGKKVFDPRTSTTAYSTNPALIINDYLVNESYGIDIDQSEIDSTALIAAANVCDETIPYDPASTITGPRYTANGSFETSARPEEILNQLVTAMAGAAIYTDGKWIVHAGAYRSPTITLTDDDLRSGLKIQSKISRRSQFNAVKGVFAAPENNFQPTDFPPIQSSVFAAEDNGQVVFKDISLPFTTSPQMANRLAKIDLLRSRQQITVSFPAKLTAFNVRVGDVINITNVRMGWTAKPFEVTSSTIVFEPGDGGEAMITGFDFELRETATNVYDYNASENPTFDPAPNTNLPDPFTAIAPSSLTLTQINVLQKDGSTIIKVAAAWVASTDAFSSTRFEIQSKRTADADSTFTSIFTDNTYFLWENVPFNVGFTVRVRSVTNFGVSSAWVTQTITTDGDTTPPAPPTGLTATAGYTNVRLDWVNPTDLDYYQTIIFASTTNNRATANEVARTSGTSYAFAGLPSSTTYYVWLKASDFSGNISDWNSATAVAVTTQATAAEPGLSALVAYQKTAQNAAAPTFTTPTTGATAPSGWSLTAPSVSVGEVLWYIQGRYNAASFTVSGVASNTTAWTGPIAATIFQDIRSDNWDGSSPPTFGTPATYGTTGYYIRRDNGVIILNSGAFRADLDVLGAAKINGATTDPGFPGEFFRLVVNSAKVDSGLLAYNSGAAGRDGIRGTAIPNGQGVLGETTTGTGVYGISTTTGTGVLASSVSGWALHVAGSGIFRWGSYSINPPDGTANKYLSANGSFKRPTFAEIDSSGANVVARLIGSSGQTTGVTDVTFSGTLTGGATGTVTWTMGTSTAAININVTSDARLKKEIQDSDIGLDFVNQLRPISYRWNHELLPSTRKQYGFVAQEVEDIVGDDTGIVEDIEVGALAGYKAFNDSGIVAALVKAVQELSKQIEELKNGDHK